VQAALRLVQQVSGRTAQNDRACLTALAPAEVNELVLANLDRLNFVALAEPDVLRILERAGNVAAGDERETLDAPKSACSMAITPASVNSCSG